MRAVLLSAALLAAGCSTHPQVHPSMQEQVVSLRQGDPESAGKLLERGARDLSARLP
jgi:hypothetical protein